MLVSYYNSYCFYHLFLSLLRTCPGNCTFFPIIFNQFVLVVDNLQRWSPSIHKHMLFHPPMGRSYSLPPLESGLALWLALTKTMQQGNFQAPDGSFCCVPLGNQIWQPTTLRPLLFEKAQDSYMGREREGTWKSTKILDMWGTPSWTFQPSPSTNHTQPSQWPQARLHEAEESPIWALSKFLTHRITRNKIPLLV